MNVKEFFETLFGDNSGFLFIGWRNDEGELNQFKHIKYPESLDTALKVIELHKDEDVYFSPMLYSVPRRKKSTVSVTPVAYADTDLFDPTKFLIAPTLNVESSEGHTHSYWVLDRGDYGREDVSRISRAIALTHDERDAAGNKIGVDPSGWDLTQLLRVPGTMNTKNTPAQPTFVRDFNGEVYSLEQIANAYDPENVAAVDIHVASSIPSVIPDPMSVLPRVASIRKLNNLYTKEPEHDQDWSDTLYLFVSEMLREGFTPAEILSVGWNAACNKYRRDGRPKEHFWEYDITRAVKDPKNRPRTKVDEEASDIPDSEKTTRPSGEGISKEIESLILSPEEVRSLEPTVVDEYVNWAKSRTDAPEPYHVAGGITIMSLLLGEWAVGDVQYGWQRLGMFFTILGETTDTRKTTARNLMKRVIRLTQVGDFDYILTSDATEEALIDVLAQRPHQSSLYDRDEVQKLIRDIKGGKGYMSGFLETLNELYDGSARGRLRANKQTSDTPVNFVQYLMGIRSQFQENLELDDFSSGWGPRNVFVRGESPPRTRENARLRQGSGNKSNVDHGLQKLAQKLTSARDYWADKQKHQRDSPYMMQFEEEAWIRQTDLEWDLKEYFEDHPKYEYLKPSLQRMSINVMKVAIMFAMMAKRDRVEMPDVLNAHYIACQWVEDLVVIVEGVSESYELRHLRAIEDFVLANEGLVTVAKALKWATTKGLKRRDFYDSVETLVEMEVLSLTEDKTGRKSLSYGFKRS
jgi:hypothetical protein